MNYFFKSLWFGALLTPKCWGCALKRNPMMAALFAAVMFLVISFSDRIFFQSAALLFVCWFLGMVLYMVMPRRHYTQRHKGKVWHLFFYDAYTKWKIGVNDDYRDSVLRVFEKSEKGWRKSGENTLVRGYDDTLADSGFILVRLPYADWIIFGNGYDMEKNVCVLGRKIAEYAFISGSKNPKLHFIHGVKIITTNILSCEKCDDVFSNAPQTYYKKAEYNEPNLCTPPANTAGERSGYFFLIQKEDGFHLFKTITWKGVSAVYEVVTDWFHIRKKGQTRVFFKNPSGTYSLSKKINY